MSNVNYKEDLRGRTERSAHRIEGDSSGLFRDDIAIPIWRCIEGEHLLDIIPYTAGSNDPDVKKGRTTYVLEVFVHQGVGIDEGMRICLSRTYGMKCPICEDRKRLQREGAGDEIIKLLTPSRYPRSIYNVLVYDTRKDEEKGVQVFHTSNYLMEQILIELARVPVRAGKREDLEPFILFADPKNGMSIQFKRQGEAQNTRFVGHKFVKRDYEISEEILRSVYCLDDLIFVPTYDELKEWYAGVESINQEQEEEKSEHSIRRRHLSEDETEPNKKQERESRSGRNYLEDETESEAEESDQKPLKLKRKVMVDEEEMKSKKTGLVCPVKNGKFGVDTDTLPECDSCRIWKECVKAQNNIE